MAKIGDERYPGELSPEEAKNWMNVLVNDFGGVAESDESFAQEVGHKSADSGTFRRKIADARKYGVMTPRGTFEATELGFQLANPPSEQERQETMFEMLQNIPLLRDIHEALNGNQPSEFWRVLTEQTNANPKDAREAADWIEQLYESMLEAENKLQQTESQNQEQDRSKEADTADQNVTFHTQPDAVSDSAIYLKVGNDELRFEELTNINIELARQFLKSKKENADDDGAVQTRLG